MLKLSDSLGKGFAELLKLVRFVGGGDGRFLGVLGGLLEIRILGLQGSDLCFQATDGLVTGVDQQELD